MIRINALLTDHTGQINQFVPIPDKANGIDTKEEQEYFDNLKKNSYEGRKKNEYKNGVLPGKKTKSKEYLEAERIFNLTPDVKSDAVKLTEGLRRNAVNIYLNRICDREKGVEHVRIYGSKTITDTQEVYILFFRIK